MSSPQDSLVTFFFSPWDWWCFCKMASSFSMPWPGHMDQALKSTGSSCDVCWYWGFAKFVYISPLLETEVPYIGKQHCTVVMHTGFRAKLSILAAHCNRWGHLESTAAWVLHLRTGFTGLGCELDIKIFKSFPCDSNIQSRLKGTALE